MAYFEPSVDADGIHIPTYADILEELIREYKSIFGEDVYLEPDSPDYQLLSVFARHLDDFSAIAVDVYNARNPDYATGNSLDLLLPLNGMSRKKATKSTAVLTIFGDEGTVLPAGSKAIDNDGYIWSTDEDFTIPSGVSGTVGASCDTPGAITAPAGSINAIYTPLVGWSGVTNAANAIPGTDVETDAEVRARRNLLFSKAANGTLESIVSALMSLGAVEFVSLVYNDTDTTDAKGLPPHSICALVQGGDSDEIAATVLRTKAPGVQTYGNTTINVVKSGVTYPVKFTRPTERTVSVTVTVKKLAGYSSSTHAPQIKAALIGDINNLGVGVTWGVTMGYKDTYSVFEGGDMPFVVTSISATNNHGTSTVEMQCDYNEILLTDDAHITVVETT